MSLLIDLKSTFLIFNKSWTNPTLYWIIGWFLAEKSKKQGAPVRKKYFRTSKSAWIEGELEAKKSKPPWTRSTGFENLVFLTGQQYPRFRYGLRCECHLIIYSASSFWHPTVGPVPTIWWYLVPDVPIPIDFIRNRQPATPIMSVQLIPSTTPPQTDLTIPNGKFAANPVEFSRQESIQSEGWTTVEFLERILM